MLILATACVEDRTYQPTGIGPGPDTSVSGDTSSLSKIFINEFVARACASSTTAPCIPLNYPATASFNGKWFELHNASAKAIELKPGRWHFSDTLGAKARYKLTAGGLSIPANGYIYIATDNLDKLEAGVLHANFSLSSGGGDIVVCYRADSTTSGESGLRVISQVSYPAQVSGYSSNDRNISYGYQTNTRGTAFVRLTKPTPGEANY